MNEFQLTPEQQKMVEDSFRRFDEAENGPPMPENLVRKMQEQAETNAALQGTEGAEIMADPPDDFFDEFLAEDEEEEE